MKYLFIVILISVGFMSEAFAKDCRFQPWGQSALLLSICQANHANSGGNSQSGSGVSSLGNTPNTATSNQHLGSVQPPHPAIVIKPTTGSKLGKVPLYYTGYAKHKAPTPGKAPVQGKSPPPSKQPIWLQIMSGGTPSQAAIQAALQAKGPPKSSPGTGKMPVWLQIMSGGPPQRGTPTVIQTSGATQASIKTPAVTHVLTHAKGKKVNFGDLSHTVDVYESKDASHTTYEEAIETGESGFNLIVIGTREP